MPSRGKKKHSLSSGRPRIKKGATARLSKKAGRQIIRSHHQLNKALHDAETTGDDETAAELKRSIEAQGGLPSYQHASLLGQSHERGGDSSQVLVQWMRDRGAGVEQTLSVLEIGALSTKNALSRSRAFAVTRIDLNSQAPGITRQDFMERVPPQSDDDRFDIISLSLVLNFVPSKEDRGRMLLHTCKFLRAPTERERVSKGPHLFLVLPGACLSNSRYMDEKRFNSIMESIGYKLEEHKATSKLIYQLWEFNAERVGPYTAFGKVEMRTGKDRNNFSVVL